jgi:hypothetical protein
VRYRPSIWPIHFRLYHCQLLAKSNIVGLKCHSGRIVSLRCGFLVAPACSHQIDDRQLIEKNDCKVNHYVWTKALERLSSNVVYWSWAKFCDGEREIHTPVIFVGKFMGVTMYCCTLFCYCQKSRSILDETSMQPNQSW